MATDKTGTCSICGKEIAISGLKNHERACAKKNEEANTNEEELKVMEETNTVEPLEEVKEAEAVEEPTVEEVPEEEVEVVTKPQPKIELVEIKLAEHVNCFIGGTRYTLQKGEVVSVPKNVKEILKTAGYLQAI